MVLIRLGIICAFITSQEVFKVSSENILLQGRYNFNHPPSVENYNPIPIIVTDNNSDDIKVKTEYDISSSESILLSKPAEDLLPPPSSIVIEASNSNDNKSNNLESIKSKERALNEQQIPVTVIYDNDDIKGKPPVQNQYLQNVKTNRQQKQLSFSKSETYRYNEEPKYKDTPPDSRISSTKNQKETRQKDPVVPILESESFLYSYRGDYRYGYESGDGTKAFGRGELKTFSDNSTGEAVEGSFSYKDKDGNSYSLTYTADENGYRPVGDHLPTPPPLPPAIERALRYLATKATPESATEKL